MDHYCRGLQAFLLVLISYCSIAHTVHVQVDHRLELSMGWDGADDLLTLMVKKRHTGHGSSCKLNKDVIGGFDKIKSRHHTIKRHVDRSKQARTTSNTTSSSTQHRESSWITVHKLKGDAISKIDWFRSRRKRAAIKHGSGNNHERFRRQAVYNGEETATHSDMEDCVLEGKSIRVNRHEKKHIPKIQITDEDRDRQEMKKVHKANTSTISKTTTTTTPKPGRDKEKEKEKEKDTLQSSSQSSQLKNSKNSASEDKGHEHQKGGNHVIVMVEVGSEARMACRACSAGDGNRRSWFGEMANGSATNSAYSGQKEGKASLVWFRLTREKEEKHFKIKEVDIDMHDDTSRDKTYVTRDHALVISNPRTRHSGSYFCKEPGENEDLTEKDSISEGQIYKLFTNAKVRYFYHLDVLKPSQEDARLVATQKDKNNSLPLPSPPVDLPDLNVAVYTDWQEWSPCSVCDVAEGTRRRVGQCLVTKMDSAKKARPVFLDTVLESYQHGVPCRSSLMHGHEKLKHLVSRKDEVLQEECNVTCEVHHAHLLLSASGFLGKAPGFDGRLKQNQFQEAEGDHVTLKCKTSVEKAVAWINGSKVMIPTRLEKETGGRVWVDEHNSLHISPARPSDSASYVCLVQGEVMGFVRLKIIPAPPECIVCRYAMYLLLTYPVNFIVYCFIAYAKHRQQKQTLNYEMLPNGGSSSSSGEESGNEEGET